MPLRAATDAELVRRARAAIAVGDREAAKRHCAELYARHQDAIFSASRRVARRNEQDEVRGHICLRFTKWVYFGNEEPRNMNGLISQMATFAAGDVTRKEAGEAPTVENIDRTSDAVGDLHRPDHGMDDFLHLLDQDLVERLLPALDERRRRLIELQLEGLEDAEIADALGILPNNVHQIRFRALNDLRAELQRQNDEIGGEG
jgi:RNA polymerase sigma factor (sigma-70 family)